jgi:hypothetical protein
MNRHGQRPTQQRRNNRREEREKKRSKKKKQGNRRVRHKAIDKTLTEKRRQSKTETPAPVRAAI